MRELLYYAFATLFSSSAALHLAPRSKSPRALSLPIKRADLDIETALRRDRNRIRKRQNGYVTVDLENQVNLYSVNFTLGTPAQQLTLSIDTGSSDLWVNVPSSQICDQGQCTGGTFNSGDSSTYKVVSNDFNITYADGSTASGDYATDSLAIGGVSLDNFQFGLGETSTVQQGVMGIGYQLNEVQVHSGNQPYANLPVALVDAGHIQVAAYSLWLNDLSASSGEILFGAVDSSKYSGSLETVPIVGSNGVYSVIAIALTGLTVNGQAQDSSELPLAVLLDSGSSLSYLPTGMLNPIFEQVNAVYDGNSGVAFAACNLAQSDGSVQFNFSGAAITVPYSELLIPATTVPGTGPRLQNGDEACYFGISESSGNIAILGDTFLRSAYVVYDLENNEISLANTATGSGSQNSDVREISKSGSVPGATAVANPVTDVSYNSNGAGQIGGPSGSNSAASERLAVSAFALFGALLAAAMMA